MWRQKLSDPDFTHAFVAVLSFILSAQALFVERLTCD
jgi:hypothetical protein